MDFNKFDRVQWTNKNQCGMIVGKNSDSSYMVCFDNDFFVSKFSKLHNGNGFNLTDGTNTSDLELPDRCRYVMSSELKLIMKHGEKVEYTDHYGIKRTGKYIVTGLHKYANKLLIELDNFYTEFPEHLRTCGTSLRTLCDIHKLVKIDINKVKLRKESNMKYVAKETITGSVIVEHSPCKTEFEKFVKEYGFFNQIEWTKETEDKFEKEDGWIEFLIENNFLTLNNSIIYDESKVYCFKFKGGQGVFKIFKYRNDTTFTVGCVSNTRLFASPTQNTLMTWEEITKLLKDKDITIHSFNSMSEACEYFDI